MGHLSCLIFVTCFLIGVYSDEDVDRANAWIDDFVEKATNDSGGFIDPLPLEELGRHFEREIGFVKVKGEAKLYDGKMYGLTTLKRKGNAVVIDLDDILIVSCQMTFKKVHAFYRGAMLLNGLGPKITLNAKIGKSVVSMFFTVPAEGGNADLMSFNINKLQDIRVSIYGLGTMGWTASILSTLALNALEKPVAKAASIKVFEHFSKEIGKYPYPGKGTTTASEAPEVTETPEVSEEPEVTETSEVSEEPEVKETPEVSEEPEVTEAPEVSEEPEVTEAPDIVENE